jgi:AmiR/NasT family two-component response regulator
MDALGKTRPAQTPLAEDPDVPVALRRLLSVTEASFEERGQLLGALRSRVLIEQAKGMLAERFRVTPQDAFGLLRGAARSRRMRIHDLARDVLEQTETPPAILAERRRLLVRGEASRR